MKKLFTHFSCVLLTTLFLLPWSAKADETTIGTAGSTNNYVPITATYTDVVGTRVQTIYPASLLEDLAGMTITAMSFPTEEASIDWGSPTFAVRLGEVEETAFTSNAFLSPSLTTVYSGAISIASNSMDIAFSENFNYSGNNSLLVEIEVLTTTGGYGFPKFKGNYASYAAFGNKVSYGGNGRASFRPMVTITYTEAGGSSCAKPSGLAYSNLSISSVDLSWTAGGSETAWNVLYKANSDADWTTVSASTNPFTLTGLSRAKSYQVKVQAVCGVDDESGFSNVVSFDTPCDITSLPWSENFESETGKNPYCWDNSASTTSYLSSYPERVWGVYTSGGNKSIRMYNYNVKAGTAVINTPKIALPATPAELTFEYVHNASLSDFSVKISTDNGASFPTILKELPAAGGGTADAPGTFQEVNIDLSSYAGQTIILQFFSTADWSSGSLFVDNINLHVKSSCTKPSLNDATDQTYEGATFSWTAGGTETQWQYIVVASGAAEDWTTPTLVYTNSVTITGKNAATTFDFYVRAYCSAESQSQSVKKSFTTASIPAPTNVNVAADETEATASWTAAAGVTGYQYCLVAKDAVTDWSEPIASTTGTSANLTGLTGSTNYDFYVRSYYAANGGTSTAVKKTFKTACSAVTVFPWENDFESESNNTIVDCWDYSGSTCPDATSYYLWGVYKSGSSGSYNNVLRMYNSLLKAGTALINTPSLTLASGKAYEFTFKYSHMASCGAFIVKVSEDGGSTFNAISGASYPASGSTSGFTPGTFNDATINLTPYSGKTIILQFCATADYDEGAIFIDNISLHEVSATCFKPTGLSAATSITPEGATFTWSASGHGEDTYQWAVAVGSADPVWVDDAAHKVAATTKTLTGLTANTSYKFFVRSYCDASNQSEAAVSASFSPVLNAPTDLAASSITASGATISWTAATGVTNYEYSLRGSDKMLPDWNSAVPVNGATSVDLTELTPNTTYHLWVRSVYNTSKSGNSLMLTFATKCEAITVTSAYTEDFNSLDNGSIPGCWDNSEGTTVNTNYKWKATTGGQDGKCLVFNGVDNYLNRTNILATPTFTLNADADLVFYWKNKKTGEYKVQISVDGGARADFVTGLTGIDAWTKVEQPLTSYNGHSVQFFFCATSINDGGGNLYLDEFQIVPQSCRKPATDPVVSAVSPTGATLTWTAGGSATDYQFCLVDAGESPVWETTNVVTALTKSFTGLEPVHSYDFYVRTYCGAGDGNQSEARMVNFTTGCGVYAAPFDANFNGETAGFEILPACWTDGGSTMTTPSYKWHVDNYVGKKNSKGVKCSSMADEEKTNILVSPQISLATGNVLSFWCKKTETDNFIVKVTKDNGANFTTVLDLTSFTSENGELKYASLSAFDNETVEIYFCNTTSGQGGTITIDNVRVARGEIFEDVVDAASESRLSALNGQTTDVITTRPMQFNGNYNTLCLPFSLNATQLADADCPLNNCELKIFDYAEVVNEELIVSIASASVVTAAAPYFFRYMGAAEADRKAVLYKEVTITESTPGYKEDDATGIRFKGVFKTDILSAENEGDEHASIFLSANNTLYWPAVDYTVNAFRAYFITAGKGVYKVKRGMPIRMVEQPKVPTAIENTNAHLNTEKRLENGQVIIIRNGVKYTIQGQKIQ